MSIEFDGDTEGVEFIENAQQDIPLRQKVKQKSPTVGFLVKNNVVKTERQATIIILVGVLLFLLGSAWLIKSSVSHPGNLYVTDSYGRTVSFELYVQRIQRGEDPFPPLNRP